MRVLEYKSVDPKQFSLQMSVGRGWTMACISLTIRNVSRSCELEMQLIPELIGEQEEPCTQMYHCSHKTYCLLHLHFNTIAKDGGTYSYSQEGRA